jgi:hypothetical protein
VPLGKKREEHQRRLEANRLKRAKEILEDPSVPESEKALARGILDAGVDSDCSEQNTDGSCVRRQLFAEG